MNEEAWSEFAKGKITPEQLDTNFNASLASYLESKPEFRKKVNSYFKHKPIVGKTPLEEAKELKKHSLRMQRKQMQAVMIEQKQQKQ